MKLGTNEARLIEALISERATRRSETHELQNVSPPVGYSVHYVKAIEELKAEGLIPTTYPN